MAEPVKMIFDDGSELKADRCPRCQCPRLLDYRCSGCASKAWQAAYNKLKEGISKASLEAHQLTP